MNEELWYTSPAKSFTEALPLGNGSLGAVVYGGVPKERITLNLDTFWSGTGKKTEKKMNLHDLDMVRGLIFDGQYRKAEEYIKDNMLGNYNESYMPLGEIDYRFTDITDFQSYNRKLNLKAGILTSSFRANDRMYIIEQFISYTDKVFVTRIKSDIPNSINLEISLTGKVKHNIYLENEMCMILSGNAPACVQPNYVVCDNPILYQMDHPGMAYGLCVKVQQESGKSEKMTEGIRVANASVVTLYTSAADGYQGFQKPIDVFPKSCEKKSMEMAEKAETVGYDTLKERHIADYDSVYKDVRLELGDEKTDLPTDVQLEDFRNGKKNLNLYSLFFHYNRYLMIASSRRGSQPANLQGIWNESLRPVWSSNWTININTQMNYWPVCVCNLLECYEPLIDMVQELSESGKETAKNQYHCKGWAANHNVDLWRQTGPVGGEPKYAYWPMGGVWLSMQIFDYYQYTGDVQYLKDKIYPVIRGSVEFCNDWLVEDADGKCYTAPSTSPENTFLDEKGRECGVSHSSTLDIALIKELFQIYIEMCETLSIKDRLLMEVKERMQHLPEYQVGKHGQLQEWFEDFDEADPCHRHFSPLFALYPGNSIEKEKTPVLAQACEKFLERRLSGQNGHIGWSCAWLINLWARLGKGNQALYYLDRLLKKSVYNNLFDLHPPLGETEGEREVFQIDGNFGAASGIANMLLESMEEGFSVLPALPDEWKKGSVRGLMAQGKIIVNIIWEDNRLKEVEFVSPICQNIKIYDCTSGMMQEFHLESNVTETWKPGQQKVIN